MADAMTPDTIKPEALPVTDEGACSARLAEQAAAGDERSFDIGQFGDEMRRVMVVAAHPDDLETACGGTVGAADPAGHRGIAGALATDGDIGTHDPAMTRANTGCHPPRRRRSTAAQVLGLKEVVFLGRHDGELVADLALRAEIAHAYRRYQPDTLFTFDPSGPARRIPTTPRPDGRRWTPTCRPRWSSITPSSWSTASRSRTSSASSSSAAATVRARS